jgi:hypothetical protein
LPSVEIAVTDDAPQEGDVTHAVKVLEETNGPRQSSITLSAPGGSTHSIYVRDNVGGAHAEGFSPRDKHLLIQFPEGSGFQEKVIQFNW